MLYNANGQLVKDDIELLMAHYNLVSDIDTGKYMHLSDIVNPFTMVPRLNHNQTMRFNIVKEKVLCTIKDACANNLSSTYMTEIQYDGYAEEHYDVYEGITKVISKEMMYGGDLHDMAVVAVLYIICKVYTHPDIQRGAIFSNGVFLCAACISLAVRLVSSVTPDCTLEIPVASCASAVSFCFPVTIPDIS